MSLKTFGQRVIFAAQKVGFKLNQKKPQICFALGCVALVGGVALVVKETFDFKEALDEANEKLETIEEYADHHVDDESEDSEYTSEDYENDISMVKRGMFIDAIVTYAPAFALLCLSLVMFTKGFSELAARNAGLLATCAILKRDSDELRKRIIETYGEEAYEKLRFGEPVAITDKGTPVFEEPVSRNSFRMIFDASSPYFTGRMDEDMMFLRQTLHKYNDMLRFKEHVWLDDIYESLGKSLDDEDEDLHYVGWVYDKDIEHKISFGPALDKLYSYGYNDLIGEKDYGYSDNKKYICLEFNVDGDIRSKVFKKKAA